MTDQNDVTIEVPEVVEVPEDPTVLDATEDEQAIVLPLGVQLGLAQLIEVPAEASLIARMAWVQGQIDYVAKTGQNKDGGGYNFRTIDGVLGALHHPLSRAGVIITPTIVKHEKVPFLGFMLGRTQPTPEGEQDYLLNPNNLTTLWIDYTFRCTTVEGEEQLTIRAVGEAIDNSDKGIGKAYSYAFKAIMSQVFTIPTADPAMDNEHVQTPQQAEAMNADPWWTELGWLSEKHHTDTRKQLFDAARNLPTATNAAMKKWMGSHTCPGTLTIPARALYDGKSVAPFISTADAQAWMDELENMAEWAEAEARGEDPFLDTPAEDTEVTAAEVAETQAPMDGTEELVAEAEAHALTVPERVLDFLAERPAGVRAIASGINASPASVAHAVESLRNDGLLDLKRVGRNEVYSVLQPVAEGDGAADAEVHPDDQPAD